MLEVQRSVVGFRLVKNAFRRWSTRPYSISLALFLAVLVVYVLVTLYLDPRDTLRGDEPHYLLVTHSLLYDYDIDLANNYAEKDYQLFRPGNLRPQMGRRQGRIYPSHTIGQSLAMIPGYLLGGRLGARLETSLMAAAVITLAYLAYRELLADDRYALVGALLMGFVSPFVFHAHQLFPEVTAALLLLLAWRNIQPKKRSWLQLLTASLSMAVLPWLNRKYAILSVVLFVYWIVTHWREWRRIIVATLPAVLSAGLYGVYLSGYGHFLAGRAANFSWRYFPAQALGLLLDQQFGLLAYAPVFLLALPGAMWLYQRGRRRETIAIAALVGGIGVQYTLFGGWFGESAPARHLVVVVPLLGVLVAEGMRGGRHLSARLLKWGLAAWSLFLAALMLLSPDSMWSNVGYGSKILQKWSRWATGFSGQFVDLTQLFPSYWAGQMLSWRTAFWVLLLGILIVWYGWVACKQRRPALAWGGLALLGSLFLVWVPLSGTFVADTAVPIVPAGITANIHPGKAERMLDGRTDTGWNGGEVTPAGAAVTLDMGSTQSPQRLSLLYRGSIRAYPRGVRVEISTDGEQWQTVLEQPDGERFSRGSQHTTPLGHRMDLDLEPAVGRYLRITQLADNPRQWTIAKVMVFGPERDYTALFDSIQAFVTAWLLPFLALGAGCLIVRGWGAPATSLVIGVQVILVTVSVVLWPALVLAEVGRFSLLWLDLVLLVICIGVGGWLRVRKRLLLSLPRPHLTVEGGILATILIMAALLFARPAEQILGGTDPATYVATGISIARTGRIPITDETLAAVPVALARDVLYTDVGRPFRDGHSFPGYYVTDAEEGEILPQFLHLFPAAIAIFYRLGGMHGALYVTPLFGLLSILMLYLLGRELAGPVVGLLAAGLLTLNISQLWFARIPFADVVLQFWLLAGLWTQVLLSGRPKKGGQNLNLLAVLSGVCFGMAHLTKLDSYIVPVIVLGFSSLTWFMRRFRRPHALLLGSYLLLSAHAALHAYLFSLPYVYDIFCKSAAYVKVAGLGLVIALPVIILIARFRARVVAVLSASIPCLTWLFVIVVVVLCIYLYFVRPLRADLGAMTEDVVAKQGTVVAALRRYATEPEMVRFSNRQVRTYAEEGLLRLGWYLTPLGVWLGIAGFLVWSTSQPATKAIPFLGATFLYSGLVFYRGSGVPDFFWAFKRFVPLVIPSFILLIAYLLWRLWTAQVRWQPRIVPAILTLFLIFSYAWGSLMFWGHIEYQGIIAGMMALNDQFPDDAVILVEKSTGGIRVGTPLAHIFGKTVFPVTPTHIATLQAREMIQEWLDVGRPVYWITAEGTEIQEYGPVIWLKEQVIAWSAAAIELEKLPEEIHTSQIRLQIYQIKGAEYRFPADLNVNFGNQIVLLGYQLDRTTVAAGDTLHLDLYWYGSRELQSDYTVFTHLLDESVTLWGQKDSPPVDGTRPTSGWTPGEIVHDTLVIPVFPDTPPGTYQISVGLYEWPTMTRLTILDEDGTPVTDRLVLAQIQVEGAD